MCPLSHAGAKSVASLQSHLKYDLPARVGQPEALSERWLRDVCLRASPCTEHPSAWNCPAAIAQAAGDQWVRTLVPGGRKPLTHAAART